MLTTDFDYDLPPERIAQYPLEPRDSSRLLVMGKGNGKLAHHLFRDLPGFLLPGDLLVFNDTRVIPARIFAKKLPGGGKVELLLLVRKSERQWETLVGGSGMNPGRVVDAGDGLLATVLEVLEGSRRLIEFSEPVENYLPAIGHVPLPPYIHTELKDGERYQTVYARQPGSAAAPTAGLHFTPQLFEQLRMLGVNTAFVDLHVGLDTFAPVTEEKADEHIIHSEWCELSSETAWLINRTRAEGGRVIAVGTTTVRTLETAARQSANKSTGIQPYTGNTRLFILPGYQFLAIDGMITNFHLPKSTLLMLVSAFAGRENILAAYQQAVMLEYRFFSFGDAMLIL